ncbi:MAG: sulfatase-like hydrolase/transferase, partial [Rhodothermales bacterium]
MTQSARWIAPAVVLLLLLAACDAPQPAGEDAPPPNIVLIVADDLGYGDLGAYGQQEIMTPRLDRMAEEGLRFTQFYAGSTVCAPSRSVLMEGRHTGRTYIRGNKEVRPYGQEPIPDSLVTMAEVLQEAGYRTGLVGKWGLG